MKLGRQLFFVIWILACSSGCKKLISVSANVLGSDSVAAFSTPASARSMMLGVYISMMDNNRSLVNGGLSIYGGLSADEFTRTSAFAQEDAFSLNALTDMNALCSGLYTSGYNWIFDCNNIIEHLQVRRSDSAYRPILGEAYFVRGFLFFYLTNLYGDLPLVLSTDYAHTALLPRSGDSLVYEQVYSDLSQAIGLLPVDYVMVSGVPNLRVRPNQATARGLLARVFLYRGKWKEAGDAASALIGDGRYSLEGDPGEAFFSGSREVIWQLQTVHERISTSEGAAFVPLPGRKPVYALTGELLSAWEAGDRRLLAWTAMASGNQWTYPYKYKLSTDTPSDQEYNVVLRLAEQYLIRAEARAQLGDSAGSAADLDVVRARAGLGPIGANRPNGLFGAIRRERQVELFAEWGHRWLDLKRWHIIDVVLGAEKRGWKPYGALYPLPYSEILHNPYLYQNNGY